jgi:hypothetical protein
MSPQRFRVEEAGLPGEGVSGIMDERPEVDSGRHAAVGLGRPLPTTSVTVESMEVLQ